MSHLAGGAIGTTGTDSKTNAAGRRRHGDSGLTSGAEATA
jgi:hypothetical protein